MTGDSTVAEIEAPGGSAFPVANAGGGRGRPLDTKASTLDTGLLDLVLHMNLYGTIYCCNAVAPIMKQQRYGKNAELLPRLTADDLKDLGITSVGHRRKLLEAIAALRPEDRPADDPGRLSSQATASPTGNLADRSALRPGDASEVLVICRPAMPPLQFGMHGNLVPGVQHPH
jgi:hypothetical protein